MPVDPRDVEDLCQALADAFPDPVDVFEDELAAELGLVRHPALALSEWRWIRVRAINSGECAVAVELWR